MMPRHLIACISLSLISIAGITQPTKRQLIDSAMKLDAIGQYQQVTWLMDKIKVDDKEGMEAQAERAYGYFMLKDLSNTELYLKWAEKYAKDSTLTIFVRGLLAGSQKKYDKALGYINEAISRQPDNFRFYYGRAELYRSMGKEEDAFNDYRQVTEICPPYFSKLKDIAAARITYLKDKKDYAAVIQEYRKLFSIQPIATMDLYAYFVFNREMIGSQQRKYEDVMNDYRVILAGNPFNMTVYNEIRSLAVWKDHPLPYNGPADRSLRDAAYDQLLNDIPKAVEAGANVNLLMSSNDRTLTPLILACSKSNLAMVKLLLGLGADPGMKDDLGQTPLHYAVKKACYQFAAADKDAPAIIALLLSHNAPVNEADISGKPAIEVALKNNVTPVINTLINAGATLEFPVDDKTPSLICDAANGLSPLMLYKVLQQLKNPNKELNQRAKKPLNYARNFGNAFVLMDAGSSPTGVDDSHILVFCKYVSRLDKNSKEYKMLMMICQEHYAEAMQLAGTFNRPDSTLFTYALFMSVDSDNPDMLNTMIAHGANSYFYVGNNCIATIAEKRKKFAAQAFLKKIPGMCGIMQADNNWEKYMAEAQTLKTEIFSLTDRAAAGFSAGRDAAAISTNCKLMYAATLKVRRLRDIIATTRTLMKSSPMSEEVQHRFTQLDVDSKSFEENNDKAANKAGCKEPDYIVR